MVVSVLKISGPNTNYNSGTIDKFAIVGVFAYLCGMFCPSSSASGNLGFVFGRSLLGLFFCNMDGFKYCWLWVVGDILGCVIAVQLYNCVIEPHVLIKRHKERSIRSYEE